MDYREIVRTFVIENFLFGEEADFEEDSSFLENSIIDSTGVLELVSFLEQTFHIVVEDDELVPENLDSLNNVVRYLEGKLDSKARQTA
ncbi:MAG: acyl carrier protein [Deltaproteobacteria bacterium]|nr:acyl carrier protein [Deltaproteobacteria bacterium]MBW2072886.1 acyl carrier protein [Deltaproteobacteria bacterium]